MTFEAHYSKTRLLGLAALALLFILFGLWIITRDADFLSDPRGRSAGVMFFLADMFNVEVATIGRIFGGFAVLLGALTALPIYHGMTATGAAIRVDEQGVLIKRRADTPILWSNIAVISPVSFGNNQLVKFKLIDAAASPARNNGGPFSFLVNRKEAVLTLQGTDGKGDALLAAIHHHAPAHLKH